MPPVAVARAFARMLNITLGRPLDSPWPALKLPAAPPPVPVAQAEIARIPHANPKVRAMKEMASAATAETRIADRERLPEVAVGVDAQLYSGTGDIKSTTVGVKLSLPWFNDPSYQAKIDAAKSRELAAGRDVETMRREIACDGADGRHRGGQRRRPGPRLFGRNPRQGP